MEAGCEELVPLVDGGELRLAHDGEVLPYLRNLNTRTILVGA